jgi:ABC-type lipoprotein export system ATPase subunit
MVTYTPNDKNNNRKKQLNTPVTDLGPQAQKLLELAGGDVEQAIAALRAAQAAASRAKRAPVDVGEVLVSAEHLVKNYKVGRQQVPALQDVSIQIRQGEFVAFTGPSGSGKSTLLQIIGGLDKATSGSVVIDGQDIARLGDRKLSEFRNKTIGFVFQFFYLQPFLSLQTNLSVPGIFARTKPAERVQRTAELAAAVGLEDRLRHLPKELSGGQMQRAAIARALLNRPKLILADEPTGNLDSVNGEAIIELFEQVRRDFGTTIVVVTHDPKVAAHADREIVLRDGKVAA